MSISFYPYSCRVQRLVIVIFSFYIILFRYIENGVSEISIIENGVYSISLLSGAMVS